MWGDDRYSIKKCEEKTKNKSYLGKFRNTDTEIMHNLIKTEIEHIFEEYFSLTAEHEAVKRLSELEKEVEADDKARERAILYEILKQSKKDRVIDFGDFGLKLEDKRIIVYLNTPQYALKNIIRSSYSSYYNDGKYYLFPETKVAIGIYKDKQYSEPFLLGSSYSPFIPEGHGTNYKICMGYYNPTPMKYPLNIVKYLQDAKKVILQGYRNGANPHRRIYEIGGKVKPISKEELQKRNIPITNE